VSRHGAGGSRDHRVQKLSENLYRISWVVDYYYADSRLRYPRVFFRDTDRAGAVRFIDRWGIAPWRYPDELTRSSEA
jgi:hypothetical protein